MSEDRILKAKDLKKMFGCSDYKLYKILSQPDFPAVKIGRDYYVKESDLDNNHLSISSLLLTGTS